MPSAASVTAAAVPDGILIYLKASMTGREDTAVLQYKATHPTFPHETTGDQFYGEDQFESYRQLGRDVALEAFERGARRAGHDHSGHHAARGRNPSADQISSSVHKVL